MKAMFVQVGLSLVGLLPDTLIRHLCRKIYARKKFREELEGIVQQLALCVQQAEMGSPGNLHDIIGRVMDLTRKHGKAQEIINKLNSLLDRLSLLGKRIQFFQDIIGQCDLSYIGRFSQEVVNILSDSARIFKDFRRILELSLEKNEYRNISQQLREDERGYPAFKDMWKDAVKTFKRASGEAHKALLEEIEPLTRFISLPEF